MSAKRILIALNILLIAILACNIGAPAPAPTQANPGENILTLAVQTLQAQSPTPAPGISVEQALTLAVETLQAQATSTNPPAPSNTNPQSTKAPKPTKTQKPTSEPPTSGLPTATATLHRFPIGTLIHPPLTLVAINPGQQSLRLDYTASANYGEANLSAGFSPDPYHVGTTSGGQVDVSYLGGSCSGFATVAPDLRINFGGGGSSLLRIYFIASNGDPAMVVNDPYGNFYCVDDSFGTVNPTIDFNNPAGGTYNVWIGSYASGTTISGTLSMTASSGNHP